MDTKTEDWIADVSGGIGEVLGDYICDGLGNILADLAGETIGTIIDAIFDDGTISPDEIDDEDRPAIILTSAVQMLAKMARIDGRIKKSEVAFISDFIDSLGLIDNDKRELEKLVNKARDDEYSIDRYANLFAAACNGDENDCVNMYLLLWRMAATDTTDGELSDDEIEVLEEIPESLGLDDEIFEYVCNHPEVFDETTDCNDQVTFVETDLSSYYSTLECTPESSNNEIKRSFKRLMRKYHPDTVEGKDLDPDIMKLISEKAASINNAYEAIKEARGM